MNLKYIGLLAALMILAGQTSVHAKWLVGGGMDYFTAKTVVIDEEDRFYHTVLQSTLMKSSVAFESDAFRVGLSGGWSDWSVSGEWQGTNVEHVAYDPFGWLGQQLIEADVEVYPFRFIALRVSAAEHRVRHYDSESDRTFLNYKMQTMHIGLDYVFYQDGSLKMKIGGAYGPKTTLVVEQDTLIPDEEFSVHYYNDSGEGHSWQGHFQFDYQDSAGWGLRVDYYYNRAMYSSFESVQAYTLTSGSIQGLLYLYF